MKLSKPTSSSKKPRRPASPQPERPRLADLQRLMAGAVMRPLTGTERMQRQWDDGRATSEIVGSFIKPNDRLTSFERLEIYNRQYWFRLLDCLHDDYPGLRAVLGDKCFHRLSIAYLGKYPSTSPNLRDLGSRLVQFLEEEPQWVEPHQTLCLDMARLEWAQVVAFDGEKRRATTMSKLAHLPAGGIFFDLQPYATLLELAYPVDHVVVRLLHREGELRSEASNAMESRVRPRQRSIAHTIKPAKSWLLVHRQENSVYFKNLTEAEYLILRNLSAGNSLLTACQATAGLSLTPDDIQNSFQTWAALGLLIAAKKPKSRT